MERVLGATAYDYKFLELTGRDCENALRELGAQGWRDVEIWRDPNTMPTEYEVLLERVGNGTPPTED